MNKFKITVETKSRSKVVEEVSSEDSLNVMRQTLLNCLETGAFQIRNTIFRSDNLNYIQVEQV